MLRTRFLKILVIIKRMIEKTATLFENLVFNDLET